MSHAWGGGRARLPRRRLLSGGVAALVGVAVGLPATARAAAGADWTSRATWDRLLGVNVTVTTAAGPVPLRLVAVDDLRGRSDRAGSLAGRDDAFVLVFDGPDDLPGGVHRLHAGGAGTFDALVVPARTLGGGVRHAVVVNRA